MVIVPLYYLDHSLYLPIRRCLDSLSGEEVVTVDDCSPLDHDFPITLQNDVNLGYTKTVNRGLQYALDLFSDIIVVCNDDIVMTPECMERFHSLPPNTIASPMDTAASNDERFGSCFGMRRDVLEKVGFLNEEYKHFFSDMDYYLRAKSLGVDIHKWYDITLEHPESSTYKLVDKEALLLEDSKTYYRVDK